MILLIVGLISPVTGSNSRALLTHQGTTLTVSPEGALYQRPVPDPVVVQDEIECLALNIYFEARGEPDPGRLAVGHVVMNRVSDNRYPGNVCAVVRQGGERLRNRCQFSWWCDGRSDRPRDMRAWGKSKVIARRIYWGFSDDITEGALWYHAVYVRPAWRKVLERGRTIGRHIFYRDEAAVRAACPTAVPVAAASAAATAAALEAAPSPVGPVVI